MQRSGPARAGVRNAEHNHRRSRVSITASPSSLSVAQGKQGKSTITTTVKGGFNNAISLSATGVPHGTTVNFSPNPIPAPGAGRSNMTISVGQSTSTGTYPITVTGRAGDYRQTTIVTLTVISASGFTISASPSTVTIVQGHQGSSTITTAINGSFNSAIILSATGMPTGTTVSFSTNPIPPPGAGISVMTIKVGVSTSIGSYPLTITGNGGGAQHTTTVTLNVTTSGPQVSLSWNPSQDQVIGYNLYRSLASGGPYSKINANLIPTTNYTDLSVQHGITYYYVATAVDREQQESMRTRMRLRQMYRSNQKKARRAAGARRVADSKSATAICPARTTTSTVDYDFKLLSCFLISAASL